MREVLSSERNIPPVDAQARFLGSLPRRQRTIFEKRLAAGAAFTIICSGPNRVSFWFGPRLVLVRTASRSCFFFFISVWSLRGVQPHCCWAGRGVQIGACNANRDVAILLQTDIYRQIQGLAKGGGGGKRGECPRRAL